MDILLLTIIVIWLLPLVVAAPFLLLLSPFILLFAVRRWLTSKNPEDIRRAAIIEAIEALILTDPAAVWRITL